MPIKLNQDDAPTLNLTPMIDIVFLLIIFFMVGTKFTEIEQQLELSVPRVSDGATEVKEPDQCVVAVVQNGSVSLDDSMMNLTELENHLTQRMLGGRKLNVIIRGDAQGAFQNVADVLSVCRRAGVSDLGISVRMATRD